MDREDIYKYVAGIVAECLDKAGQERLAIIDEAERNGIEASEVGNIWIMSLYMPNQRGVNTGYINYTYPVDKPIIGETRGGMLEKVLCEIDKRFEAIEHEETAMLCAIVTPAPIDLETGVQGKGEFIPVMYGYDEKVQKYIADRGV